jgi:hypothetical protein
LSGIHFVNDDEFYEGKSFCLQILTLPRGCRILGPQTIGPTCVYHLCSAFSEMVVSDVCSQHLIPL